MQLIKGEKNRQTKNNNRAYIKKKKKTISRTGKKK